MDLLKVVVNLFSIKWLNVDISVLPWAHFAALASSSIFNFVIFAESLSVFEFALGLLKLIAHMAMFSVHGLRVVVAALATVESLFMMMVLGLLDQEILEDRELLFMMDTLMDGHLMTALFTIEKRSLTVKGPLNRFLALTVSATVIVSDLVSLVNSMLMEVSRLDIVLVIVTMVKFGMDFSFVATRFMKNGFSSCHFVTDFFIVKTFAKDTFMANTLLISTLVTDRFVTDRFVTDRFMFSTFLANSLASDRLMSDTFAAKSFASDALLSIALVANRHMFSDAFVTSGTSAASLKMTLLISEKRELFDVMASSHTVLWSVMEVILHFIVVEFIFIVMVKAMVYGSFMEMDWLNIMSIVKSMLHAVMVIHVSVHVHLEVSRMVSLDLLLHRMLG